MKLDVTREVVTDLWSLYRAGDATADSKALVDSFLAEDPAFAETLRTSEQLTSAVPPLRLSADAERRLLDEVRQRARTRLLLIGGALAVVAVLAFAALGGALFLTLVS